MSGASRANVFISHAHADSEMADALSQAVDSLFEKAVSVSYSTKRADGGIPTGADWFRWIGDQVAHSQVTIVLLTPQFLANPAWLLWETGAVYGAALADIDGRSARVRPLRYRVDQGDLPAPLRAANVQMTSGESSEAMCQFFAELISEVDVLDKSHAVRAGTRLAEVVTAYLEQVEPLLNNPPPAVPTEPARDPDTLKKLMELTISAMQAFYPSVKMNGRYFYTDTKSGRDQLVRDEDVYFETIPMPEEFGLSRVDVERGADTIVMCQSFKRRTPIYEVLGPELMERYPPDLRDVISPSQGWVLACPVGVHGAKPFGVVCLYGERPPARNADEVRRLRTVAMRLSEMLCRTICRAGA
jgi:hypothetical protein